MSQHSTTVASQTELTFPPVPLVSGNTLTGADGRPRRVTAVAVAVSTADPDASTRIALDERFGGWWRFAGAANKTAAGSEDAPAVASPHLELRHPPIPLATGHTITDAGGDHHAITALTLVVSLDGAVDTVEIPLVATLGGWWAPEFAPTA